MAVWDDIITERDKQVYEGSGMGGKRAGPGKKPAIVVIDVNYNWVGDKPEPILESIKRFPFSCGEEGWKAVNQIASLLPLAREKKVPVIYSTAQERASELEKGRWLSKSKRSMEAARIDIGTQIVKEIAPMENDIVIRKTKPSIFFGTPLMSFLNMIGVDTLFFCGGTTSGCVRASVIDGFSYNFRVSIIEECTFDRGEVSHKVNLFDMNAKYGDVVSVAEVKKYLASL
ncbi:MAG: isochorismatase family protein [Dehalococcoidia bacterium]|nr:isochorismatase family protein [Dehalococcoidia bacterium]